MKKDIKKYFRIGTEYYKEIKLPTTYKTQLILKKWSLSNLKNDFSKDEIDSIPKYNAFCNMPEHINYQRIFDNCYNKYEPLPYQAEEGTWYNTEMFLKHIFEEHYEIGLDYLTILFRKPTQCLPVLCLVSNERKTGKTTFINWLKNMFGANMTINSSNDMRSQFNSDWSGKLIIAVDETLFDKVEDTEKIKQLSTGKLTKEERKGVDKLEVQFFGKFILCSNNETSFIKIDQEETRFWVRKINPFENEDNNLEKKITQEIPAFLYYLKSRETSTPYTTRTWFDESLLVTKSLLKLKNANKSCIEKEIFQMLLDTLDEFQLELIEVSKKDIRETLQTSGYRISLSHLRDILEEKHGLMPSNSKTYYKPNWIEPQTKETISKESHKGRVYSFTRNQLNDLLFC